MSIPSGSGLSPSSGISSVLSFGLPARKESRDSGGLFRLLVHAQPCDAHTASPMSVIREDVISRLHARVAREPALGVVPLRRLASHGAGRERIGSSVIVEHGVSPPAAVREPLAVLHHEVHIMLSTWHPRREERLHLFQVPMYLRQLGASGKRLAVAGNAGHVSLDHYRIREDRGHKGSVLTDRDNLPGLDTRPGRLSRSVK